MHPALRCAVLASACLAAFALAGCGKHVPANAPITYAPADTPYLLANFKGTPADASKAWSGAGDASTTLRIQQLNEWAQDVEPRAPRMALALSAIHDELANVHSNKELLQALGMSPSALIAIYGIGDVPVIRAELASPKTFNAFWTRVEKRAGIKTSTATLDGQTYRVLGGPAARLHVLVAVEGKQLVITVAPSTASPDMLKRLLGLTKPSHNAVDRLARLDSQHGYSDYGSGYIDFPKFFANLYDGKDALTQASAKALGSASPDPRCAGEFASLASQAPLASLGIDTYTAKEVRVSFDLQLSPALLGALTALKQPVPGMAATHDNSMFDMELSLPLKKWQAFLKGRAEAAARKPYQCPALQSLNKFAQTAANPPVQMPPEAASLLGIRVMIDQWEAGPQIAGRILVASSDTTTLAQKIQQTLPQFALKTIPTNGKPVAFMLPRKLQAMLGSGNQGWFAADSHSIVLGIGSDEEAKLDDALNAPPGKGDLLFRSHMDGKMYGVLSGMFAHFAAIAPSHNQSDVHLMAAVFRQLGKTVASANTEVKLDDKGLHAESDVTHR